VTDNQARACIRYLNGHFPQGGIADEDAIHTYRVNLLPLDYPTALEAIRLACEGARGYVPTWADVGARYAGLEAVQRVAAMAMESERVQLALDSGGPSVWARFWTQVYLFAWLSAVARWQARRERELGELRARRMAPMPDAARVEWEDLRRQFVGCRRCG
jgi:hypothetical protein